MEPAPLARLREGLAREAAEALDPAALAAAEITVARHGTMVAHVRVAGGPPRRTLALDRAGRLQSVLRWAGPATLGAAWVRIPDGSWLGVEPRMAGAVAPWAPADRLWHVERPQAMPGARGSTPLTVLAAVDWARIEAIPPLAEPGRLPPGGGTAVLNLIAALAQDQGVGRLGYRGPYPTEQLFLGLLESFRYLSDAADPLAAFMAGGLEWAPAPHERLLSAAGVWLELRERIEKVVWRGRAYHRDEAQGVRRHAPRRLRDVEGGVACSLWALGDVLEDHLVLDATGGIRSGAPADDPAGAPAGASPIPRVVWQGILATVAATSAAALAPGIRAIGDGLRPAWGAVPGDLVAVGGGTLRFSDRLRGRIVERLEATADGGERAALALAAVAELGALVGDALRARAQARLAALAADEQANALAEAPDPRDRDAARTITLAVEGLLALASGQGVDDHPDVQADEERDR